MIGTKLSDRYEIVSELGRGGMGVVYRARDPRLNREVAVKVVAPELLTSETEQRFQTEAQLVAQMDHPSIVAIHDFGRHEGSMFFVMPIVEGESLRHHLREGSLRLGTVVDLGIEVAEALEYSHSRGVIHRDIKPENIMVSLDEGGGVRVRIMDFGLARGTNVSSLTKTGMLVGTMSYISPEQVMGGTVDGRSDIYALGCVLYECVVNEVPFSGEMQSVLYRVVHELAQSPREQGAAIEPELEEIVLSCLAKEPADRPQTAGELAQSLRRHKSKLRDSQRMQSVMLTRTMQAPRPTLSPLVGREAEFAELQRRLNGACRGQCQFVVVAGEPGVGKTRLVDELETLAAARSVRVLHGRFVEKGGAFPYNGFCEAIQDFYQQKELGSTSSGLPDLSELAADLISLFPMLSEIEPVRSAATGASQLSTANEARSPENRTQVFELLARTLTLLGGGKPLVLILEDLHGADVSIEALQYIVHRLGPTPTLLVGTYQTTEVDRRHPLAQMLEGFQGDRRFQETVLEPFTADEHRQFLKTLTGGSEIDGDLATRLFEATEGNPFFTKELVRSLLDAGSIAQDETGSWRLSGGMEISSDALPATIQQAVERRIGRLPGELRRILSIASVMGKSFDFDDLEALAVDDQDLDDAVDRFIQAGLIEEDRQSRGDRLTFTSAVVREVLYAELPRRRRRSVHRKYAGRLEKRHAGRLERVYPQLLYHFSEGDEPAKTVEFGLLHARRSLESFSPDEAIRAAKTALEFLDEDWEGDPSVEGEARLLLADAYRMAGDIPGALHEIGEAIQVFERLDRAERTLEALLVAARTAWQARRTEEARRWAERGIEAARTASENELLGQFLLLSATLANLRGEYAKGSELLREAEQLMDKAEETEPDQEIPRGGVLVAALASPVSAKNPAEMQLTEEFETLTNIYETLLVTDEEGNLHPSLCEDWQVQDQGKTLRLTLRSDVTFQDGHVLSAADVKDSFERGIRAVTGDLPPAMAAISGVTEFLAGADEVAGILAHSDTELEIGLAYELPIYPTLLTDGRTAITRVPSTGSSDAAALLGTGPFKVKSRTVDRLVLERHADYWRGALPALDGVEFRSYPNASAIATGFRSGEIDLARDLLPRDFEEILRDPRFHDRLIEKPQKFSYFILFNAVSGPVARNPAVRRALAESVRSRELVWQTLGRYAEPATGLIPPGILGHDPGRRRSFLSRAEAKEILAAEGLVAGCELKAAVHPIMQERYGALLEGLFSAWSELGVEVDVATPDTESFLEAWHANEGFDLMIGRWRPDIDDPDDCTHSLFQSGSGQFRSYFSAADTDEILESARRELSPATREGLYRKFESHLLETHVLVPLFNDVGYRLISSKVLGAELLEKPPYVNYAQLGKTESAGRRPPVRSAVHGVLQMALGREVDTLDPADFTLLEEYESMCCTYETLLRDVGDARIEPWLAAEYRVEDDGKRHLFRLREEVTFHDGRRLSARDVRHTFERLLQSRNSQMRWFFAPILGAQAILDGKTRNLAGFQIHSASEFSIELEQPVSFFSALLTTPAASIVPEGTLAVGPTYRQGAVGTGPFRIIDYKPSQRLELERYPGYWRRGYPRSEGLVFRYDLSPSEILAEFRAGRLSMASDLFPDDVEALRRDPEFAAGFCEIPRLSTYIVAFNVHRGPLQNKALRQRLVQAVDVTKIVRQTLGNLAIPARGMIPPGLIGHEELHAGSLPGRTKPPAEAAEEPLELTAVVHPIFDGELSRFAEQITEAFREVGVTFRSVNAGIGEFLEATQKGEADLFIGRWIADYPDADTFVYQYQRAEGLIGRFCGLPEIDRLIAESRVETDPASRHAVYRRIEEIAGEEVLTLPLFHEQAYRFVRPEVQGVNLSYWAPTVRYEEVSLESPGQTDSRF